MSSNVNIFCLEHFYTIRYNTFLHTFLCSTKYQKLVFYAGIPLNTSKNFSHHSRSLKNSTSRRHFADCLWREFIRSKMRRRKVLPPYTTLQAQLRRPASCCSCLLEAGLLELNEESTSFSLCNLFWGKERVNDCVSISTPRKVSF